MTRQHKQVYTLNVGRTAFLSLLPVNGTMNSSVVNATNDSTERNVKLVVYFSTFVVGLTGNVLVVVIIAKRKAKKSMNDIFVINLSVSDLCLIVLCLPALIYLELVGYVGSRFYCKFVWPMMTVSYCASVFTITSMACYRCRVLLHPFEPPPRKKCVMAWISTIWLMSFVIASPLMIASEFREHFRGSSCHEDWPSVSFKRGYTVVLFIFQYLLPLLTIAVAYVRIVIDLTRTEVERGSMRGRGTISTQGTRKENVRITKNLAAIVILFALCMLPVHLAWMLLDFGGEREIKVSGIIYKFSDILAILHSCLNAVIYGALAKHLRHGYKKYLAFALKLCCRKRKIRKKDRRQRIQKNCTSELVVISR